MHTQPTAAIMQVALSLDPGGTERLVVELAKRASARFAVSVCCLDAPGAWASELSSCGIDVIALDRRPGFRPSLGVKIAREAKARGVHILHCHHYSPFVYGGLARLANPALRLVFTEHGRLSDAVPTLKRQIVTPLLAALAHEMYAVSEDLRQYMVSAGFPARKVGVIPNGIVVGPVPQPSARARARELLGAAPGDRLIMAVGRLDPVKDLPTLLRALPLLKDEAATLHLIGDGAERASLARLAAELDVASRVRFAGYRADARDLLPAADVFVNSSISEGISLTLLEAMAAVLPIVATAVGGTPEVVLDGITGRVVPPRRPAALAAALDDVLGSPDTCRRMGEAGRARVEAFFTLDRMAERYLAAYDRLAI